jgi:hypothetical protein
MKHELLLTCHSEKVGTKSYNLSQRLQQKQAQQGLGIQREQTTTLTVLQPLLDEIQRVKEEKLPDVRYVQNVILV